MKRILIILAAVLMTVSAAAQRPAVFHLWPDGAPTSNGLSGDETTDPSGRIGNISDPTVTVYPARNPNGICVIACPGGGYSYVSSKYEGHDMADWMNAQGITFAVLHYRMPNGHHEVPLADGEQAVRIMRAHAGEWGVNPQKIGVMGFSAGGHFAATVSTLFTSPESRPDFSVLIYPVITMEDGITHGGTKMNLVGKSPDASLVERYDLYRQVNSSTPPAFIALSADDMTVPPANGIRYFESLVSNHVKGCSLHIYPVGGHGWGFRDSFTYKRQWTAELEKWIDEVIK